MATLSYFNNVKLDNRNLSFEINNLDVSFVNALRRIIISEVSTIGFRTEPYDKSTVKILANTSSLHNEFISHRFGMIPVGFSDVDNYNELDYKFVLNIQNTTNEIINVTTKNIDIYKRSDEGSDYILVEDDKIRDSFFPPDPISNDYILINRLKPDTTGNKNGEHLHIEATAVKSNGKENSRWSPVCDSSFNNKIDETKALTVLDSIKDEFKQKNNGNMTQEQEKAITHRFKIFEAGRHYHTNDNLEPNVFEFRIESIGIISPKNILLSAINVLKNKLNKFLENINNDNSDVIILESDTIQKSFDIHITNEDHTLGYLVQSYLTIFNDTDEDFNYVGYNQPHPLDNKIIIRIGLQNHTTDNLKKYLNECLNKLIILCQSTYTEFETY